MYYLRSLLIFPYEIDSTSYIEINNQHIFGIYHILIVDSEFFTMWSQLNLMKCIRYLPSLPYRADKKYIYITRFRNISNLFSNFRYRYHNAIRQKSQHGLFHIRSLISTCTWYQHLSLPGLMYQNLGLIR